jgi:hypothetical protein
MEPQPERLSPLQVLWQALVSVEPWIWIVAILVGLALYWFRYRPMIRERKRPAGKG